MPDASRAAPDVLPFLLCQMNDALLPIGAFSHSWGFETYIQKNLVRGAKDAEEWLRSWLSGAFLYGDLLCAALAWECARKKKIEDILSLEEKAAASKSPRELRDAALKLGSRFVKTMLPETAASGADFFSIYAAALKERELLPSHAAAYGCRCGSLNLPRKESLIPFAYAQTSSLVTCCVKTIPLSQSAGQSILAALFPLLASMTDKLEALGEDDLYRACPAFDFRAMEHETLYSRLFMS